MTITNKVVRLARKKGVTVYGHRQWGSLSIATYALRRRIKKHRILPEDPCDTLWQHISVTHNTDDFKYDCRLIERIGNQRFRVGSSYNVLWDPVTGEIAIGQPFDAKGAHTLNDKGVRTPDGALLSVDQNAVSLAVAAVGMPGIKPTAKGINSLGLFLRACIEGEALTPRFDYLPHRLVAYKECPTDAIADAMPEVYAIATGAEPREESVSRSTRRPPVKKKKKKPKLPNRNKAVRDLVRARKHTKKGGPRNKRLTRIIKWLRSWG